MATKKLKTMKNINFFEVVVGTIVLFCALIFLYSSTKSAKITAPTGYSLIAKFDNASGIEAGSDVSVSGVKVGTVNNYFLDQQSYRAVIEFSVNKDIKLPIDSSVKITSSGLLGSKYLEISPGSDEEFLTEGSEVLFTQSSISLEELLGKFLFSSETSQKE